MNSPSNPVVQEVPEEAELFDVDGPVLLELREAISDELEGFGLLDEEGEPLFADHRACELVGNEVSDRVQKKLEAAYPAIRKEIEAEVRAEEREQVETAIRLACERDGPNEVNIRIREDPNDPDALIVDRHFRPPVNRFVTDDELPETHKLAALMLREVPFAGEPTDV